VKHDGCATLALLLALLWGAADPALGEAERTDPDSGRVVLVPLNLGVRAAEEVEPGIEPVWQEILQHFSAQERPVTAIERSSGTALWNEVMAELQASGDGDVYSAYARFARRVADELDYETIVFPSLVKRVAKARGETAYWDGVRQRVETPALPVVRIDGPGGSGLVVSQKGVRGQLAAVSLHVAVLQPSGELCFEGAGGLTLLHELTPSREEGELVAKPRTDAFEDGDALRLGIEAAFRQPLPASRAE
jgi:hypothetical protein